MYKPSILLAILFTLSMVSCVSAGHKFTIQQANKITNGMTREEVIAIMGSKPNTVTDATKTFIWSYANVNFIGTMKSRTVKISFDENGKSYGIPKEGVFGNTEKYQ